VGENKTPMVLHIRVGIRVVFLRSISASVSIVRKINRKPRYDLTAHDEQRNSSNNDNNNNNGNNNESKNYEKKKKTRNTNGNFDR